MPFSVFYSRFLEKLNIELPYNPGLPWRAIHLKEVRTDIRTHTCAQMFIAALFTITKKKKKNVETTKCPSADAEINKMRCMHKTEHYTAIKRTKALTHGTMCRTLEKIILRESSQAQKGNIV